MVCLGLKPRAAGWKAETNPLSYGGTPQEHNFEALRLIYTSLYTLYHYFNYGKIIWELKESIKRR